MNKKYAKILRQQETPKGKTWTVDVADPYVYIPNCFSIKVNDFIKWNWTKSGGGQPHDVT